MQENQEDKSRIDRLKKKLYTKGGTYFKRRSELSEKSYDVKSNWEEDVSSENVEMQNKKQKRKTLMEKILIGSIIFFFVSILVVSATFFSGFNKVSTKNVDISVVGPTTMESGGELSMYITITNNNSTDLELADLIIDYPAGTYSIENNKQEVTTIRETLDTIPAGRSVRKEIKTIMYGEENSNKEIIISLEYRIADSNAIFFKDLKYEIKISSSPVNLVVSPIEEVISGQDMELTVSAISNTENPVNNLLLVAEYPFGFEYTGSDPKPDFGDNIWKIENKKSIIKIKGKISGQDDEERIFKFTCGTSSEKDEKIVGAIFASITKMLVIKKPFIGIDVAINGNKSPEYVSGAGSNLRFDISWSNNSVAKILDGEIEVKLKGSIIDKSSVVVDRGYYRSVNNTIVWNKNTNGELSEIGPGESGRLGFSFNLLDNYSSNVFVNPEINIDFSAKGNRVSESNIIESIDSSISRKIKIGSDLLVTPRAIYYSGPFVNSGPIPPKVDKETTYTITWNITNTYNSVSDAMVISSLPTYMKWMGVVSPKSENIYYNPVGGEIIWTVGDIKSGTGISSGSKEISFQVALLPSISQVGQIPRLINDVTITGVDKFTNNELKNTIKGVTTRLNTDPAFSSGDEIVKE